MDAPLRAQQEGCFRQASMQLRPQHARVQRQIKNCQPCVPAPAIDRLSVACKAETLPAIPSVAKQGCEFPIHYGCSRTLS
eukprot:1152166-Pelagomonas_calceolata.AAC.2